jgi:hypothetical protein
VSVEEAVASRHREITIGEKTVPRAEFLGQLWLLSFESGLIARIWTPSSPSWSRQLEVLEPGAQKGHQ